MRHAKAAETIQCHKRTETKVHACGAGRGGPSDTRQHGLE